MKRVRRPAAARPRSPAGSPAPRPPQGPNAALLADVLRGLDEGVLIAESRLTTAGVKITFVNDAFCRITGYEVGEVVGRRHGFLHPTPAHLAALRRWHRRATREPFTGEGFVHHKNGLRVYAAWSFRPIFDARGRRTHLVGEYRDLTEKRRLEDELVHAQRLDAVGRLAGGVAHDFNNLLSVINGYCEILADSVGANAKARKEVAAIHQAGQRANALVRQLLAFGRRQSITPRVFSLNRLVRENTGILTRLLQPEGTLRTSLEDELPNVRADETQLQQVLLNLTLNARDALKPGGLVTITTRRREVQKHRRAGDLPPGRYVVLAVSDNGIGMDAETQAHLFEPFFTTKGEGKGTGLGLALVYGVVQQSGGYIFVHSAPHLGSTFEIFLPEVLAAAEVAGDALAPLPVTRGHETIVLAEQDDVVRKMVSGILTADGYHVVAAASPGDALQELNRQGRAAHLLVIDPAAGAADCQRVVRALQQKDAGLRVIWTSQHELPPGTVHAAATHLVLPKPFALAALLRAVRRLLDAPDAPPPGARSRAPQNPVDRTG